MNKDDLQKNHGLASGIVYGPVPSRRFGFTLGVNLLPGDRKHCSFNCVYCQLDWTDRRFQPSANEFPTIRAVANAFKTAQSSAAWRGDISYIVVSGNGEPTLHPEFLEVVRTLIRFRDENLPEAKLVCFTCGSELANKKVFRALQYFDECHVKLDADLLRVDLPPKGLDIDDMLNHAAKLGNLVIQSCFTAGVVDNSGDAVVIEWLELVKRIQPRRVDIYTIERQTAAEGLVPVLRKRLMTIAKKLRKAGVKDVRVVG